MAVKIPLTAKKDLRDNFENTIPDLQARLEKATGLASVTFDPNTSTLYPDLLAKNYGEKLGSITHAYFAPAVAAIEKLTAEGSNEEAIVALKSLMGQNTIRLDASQEVEFCKVKFADGTLLLLYNPEWVWTNAGHIGDDLVQEMDAKLVELGQLPYTTRRAIQTELEPAIAEFEQKFKQLFGKDFTAEYDVTAALTSVKAAYFAKDGAEKWFGKWPRFVPEAIGRYYTTLARRLEKDNFGRDDILQEGFIEAVAKAVVRFELVEELPEKKAQHAVVLKDGVARIQTTANSFGNGLSSVGEDVEDFL